MILVLYKTDLLNSETFKSLVKSATELNTSDKLCIWDNSPIAQNENNIIKANELLTCEISYTNTPENISLAKIYNYIIKINTSFDFITIFDQDSNFNFEYFKALTTSIIKSNVNLFLPIINQNNIIVSPANLKIYRGVPWKNKVIGLINAKNKLAVASGMTIRYSYLKSQSKPFDENLTLYGIDTAFMLAYSKLNDFFCVIDYEMKHDMSYFDKYELIETKIFRFKNHKKSLKLIFGKISLCNFYGIRIYLLFRSILMCYRYKNLEFLQND